MKVCFIGLGSIAIRHISNLTKIMESRNEKLLIDVYRTGSGNKTSDDIMEKLNHIYYAPEKPTDYYDIIFITNPTKYHFASLEEFSNIGKAFFIEKPVFDDYDLKIADLHLCKEKIYYVACPLRFTKIIQYLKNKIDFSKVLCLRCISSSFLPDWRPGTDYRKTYSAHKELGGGVAIDLIHEWDYITYLIGMPLAVESIVGKISNLEIDSDDIAIYLGRYKDKVVELHLDYFGRMPIRKIEIFTTEDTIQADLIAGNIHYMKADQTIDLRDDRDAYQQRELKYFLNMLHNESENINNIMNAYEILKLTRGGV